MLDQKLVEDQTNGNVKYTDSDGTEHIFTKTLDNKYSAPQGVYLALEKTSDKTFKLTELQTGSYSTFETHGSLYAITSAVTKTNNKLNFVYSGDRLMSVRLENDDSARAPKFSYNVNGQIESITSPGTNDPATGQNTTNVVKFAYEGDALLSEITEAYGTDQARSTKYKHSSYPTSKNLTGIIYPNGNEAIYRYDSAGRVTQVNGSNIVYNPGFDQLAPGVIPGWSSTVPEGTSIEVVGDSFSGQKAVKLDKSVPTASALELKSDAISVEPNKDYQLSFYAKTSGLNAAAGLHGVQLKGYDPSNQLIFNKYAATQTEKWSRFAIPFNSGSSTRVEISAILDSDRSGQLLLDAFQLELKVSALINSEQEWQQTDTDAFQWNAGSLDRIDTASTPGALELAKVQADIVKTDKTQTQLQQGTLSGTTATADNKLELRQEGGWWGRWWTKTGTTYDVMDLVSAPSVDSIYSALDFRDANPGGQLDYYNGRFEGYLLPNTSEPYTLDVTADDGVRIWFEGTLVIDQWIPQPAAAYSWITPTLQAGKKYNVVVEHYERAGAERLTLEWVSNSQAREVIPQAQTLSKYYPSGTRVHEIDVSTLNPAADANIGWSENKPAGTSIAVETNLILNGIAQGWNPVTNYGSIPGIAPGVDLSQAKLQIRETLSTSDLTVTPQLSDLSIQLKHEYLASGVWTSPVYLVAPGTGFTQGLMDWQADIPTGTTVTLEYRTSADGTEWSAWAAAGQGANLPFQGYIQYKVNLGTTDASVSPKVKAVILSYLAEGMYEADLGVESANNAQSFDYNDGTRVTTVTDPNGIVTEYGHNPFGNVTSFRDDVNGKNVQTTFAYDNRFNLTKMTDANGEYRYLYDQYGNLVNKVDPDGGTTVNAYDKNNNLIRSTEPFGYTGNLLLNSNFENSKDGRADYNRQTGWWGRWWQKTGTDMDSMNLAAAPAVDTVHPTVNFTDYNPGGQADYYNTHLEGSIIPASSEAYNLYVTADDGVRLWFDGILVVDRWVPQYASTYSWTTPILEAGKPYQVVIEHYERQGAERLTLEWESASQTREVIPQSRVVNKYTNFTRGSDAYTDESPLVGSGNPRFVGNLAYGKSVSYSPETTVQPNTSLSQITNGDLSLTNYAQLESIGQPVYVQVDLGSLQNVSTVKVWHYYADGLSYHNTKTQVSADGTNWTTIFDSAISGEYPETASGKTHTLSPAMNIRYIRDYVNGNSMNIGNHWVEIQAFNQFGQALLMEEGTTNLLTNNSFETITGTATAFASDMKSSAGWTPLSGSFTFSANGAVSQASTSELKTGLGLWKPIVGSNGQPNYVEVGSWFTTSAFVPRTMEVKLYQDSNNWYQAVWQGDNNFVIYKYYGNSHTPLAWNAMAVSQAANTSYKIVLRIDSNQSLQASILNGTTNAVLSTITFTDSSVSGPFDFVVGADAGVLVTKSNVYAPLPDGYTE